MNEMNELTQLLIVFGVVVGFPVMIFCANVIADEMMGKFNLKVEDDLFDNED